MGPVSTVACDGPASPEGRPPEEAVDTSAAEPSRAAVPACHVRQRLHKRLPNPTYSSEHAMITVTGLTKQYGAP
jgi:hypothetical protein